MGEKILVSGGGGFLGAAICRLLKAKGYEVISFSRKTYPELTKQGIKCVQGSIGSVGDLTKAMKGCAGVVHTAAYVGTWGPYKDYYETNVKGTENVVRVAQNLGVTRLVFTSSPSVVFDGKDICGGDESLPYPKKFLSYYQHTKMLAEKHVLENHGERGLATVSIRPHLIWGPGDPHFIPRIQAAAKLGKLKRVGDLSNKTDITYVDNAAEAHILALDELSFESRIGGRAYFVGQESPVSVWAFVDQLLSCLDMPNLKRRIPGPMAWMTGLALETLYKTFKIYDKEPPMTRFVALKMSRSCYFSHLQAKRDFGYKPRVSTAEGLEHVRAYLKAMSPPS